MLSSPSKPGRRRAAFATLALLALGAVMAGSSATAAELPVAGPVPNVTTEEDAAVQIVLTGSDGDGESLTFIHIDGPAHGELSAIGAPDCEPGPPSSCEATVTYTPDDDYEGPDVFTYSVSDGADGTSLADAVDITVTPQNDSPVAADDVANGSEDLAEDVFVLDNDTDVDGDLVTVTDATDGDHGTVDIVGSGNNVRVRYTPEADFHGVDSFDYTVGDGSGGSDTATVTITVQPVNDPPDAVDDEVTLPENQGTRILPVLDNDTDIEGDSLGVAEASDPDHGTTIVQNGVLRYRPVTGFVGVDTFTYVAEDDPGDTDTATVTVTVVAVDDPPDAVDDSATVDEDEDAVIDVRANDTDPDSGPGTIVDVTGADHGTLSTDGDDVFYTPASNYNGPDSFQYTLEDTGGNQDTGTVSVTVEPVNDHPVADNDAATGTEDQPWTINVLNGDTDVDGDTLTIVDTTDGAHGTVAITMAGTRVRYTPSADFFGSDTFTYTIGDGHGAEATATVGVTIAAVNDIPTAVDDGTPGPIPVAQHLGPTPIDVLANDTTSPDTGESLAIVAVTQGANGAVAVAGGGSGLTYDPTGSFTGDDSFTYTVSDGLLEATATVHVHVAPDVTAPVASIRVVGTAGATSSSIRVTITWSAFELQSGVSLYQLQQQIDGGAWTTVALTTPTTTSLERVLAGGHSYAFRVRARDGIGNLGAYSTSPPLRI